MEKTENDSEWLPAKNMAAIWSSDNDANVLCTHDVFIYGWEALLRFQRNMDL